MLFQPYVLVVSKCFKCSKTERKKKKYMEKVAKVLSKVLLYFISPLKRPVLMLMSRGWFELWLQR